VPLYLTGKDIEAAIGVPFNDDTDAAYADLAAKAATAYVNSLPIAAGDVGVRLPDDVQLAGLQLGVNLYTRRPAGAVAPDFEFAAPQGIDPIVSRLLRIGRFAPPVIA